MKSYMELEKENEKLKREINHLTECLHDNTANYEKENKALKEAVCWLARLVIEQQDHRYEAMSRPGKECLEYLQDGFPIVYGIDNHRLLTELGEYAPYSIPRKLLEEILKEKESAK